MICNDSNKDGWLKVFKGGLLYCALRDVFNSIETCGTGGGLYRNLFAAFLDESTAITGESGFKDAAAEYGGLASRWSMLGQEALPREVPALRQTGELLRKKHDLYESKGAKASQQMQDAAEKLRALEKQTRESFPLIQQDTARLLEGMRDRIVALHRDEIAVAKRLLQLIQ
jgi:hypothetical protein